MGSAVKAVAARWFTQNSIHKSIMPPSSTWPRESSTSLRKRNRQRAVAVVENAQPCSLIRVTYKDRRSIPTKGEPLHGKLETAQWYLACGPYDNHDFQWLAHLQTASGPHTAWSSSSTMQLASSTMVSKRCTARSPSTCRPAQLKGNRL